MQNSMDTGCFISFEEISPERALHRPHSNETVAIGNVAYYLPIPHELDIKIIEVIQMNSFVESCILLWQINFFFIWAGSEWKRY